MPRVVVIHAVEDVERWLEGKAERAAAIGAVGTNVTDYVALDGSNKIAITADIHDLDGRTGTVLLAATRRRRRDAEARRRAADHRVRGSALESTPR